MVDIVRRLGESVVLRMEKKHFGRSVRGEISLLTDGPERSLRLLVHLPDVVVDNGKHGEAVDVLVEERLGLHQLLVSAGTHCVRCVLRGEESFFSRVWKVMACVCLFLAF